MTDSKLNYIGPLPDALSGSRTQQPFWRRLPWPLLVVVVIPTLIAAIYFLLIASPRYVSQAQFIVRAPGQGQQPSALGVALQGVGLSSTQTDAFAVHEYVKSRDSLRELRTRHDVAAMLGARGADMFSRYPRFWESRSDEGLYNGLQRFVVVGYDSTTGISTLRVEAFTARDANALAEGLLQGGEGLVNRLNERSSRDTLAYAVAAQLRAEETVAASQQAIAAFRNREQFLDPELSAREGTELIGKLRATVAELQAERTQLAADAPASPQLPALNGRIAAYEAQIASERSKLTGGAGALAPQIGAYERLVLDRELADRQLSQATAAVVAAQQDSIRQKLYLERVVSPSLPDEPQEPKRWLALLSVFATTLLIYGIGSLVWAGVREHWHD